MFERLRKKRELPVARLSGGHQRELPHHQCDENRGQEGSESGHVRVAIKGRKGIVLKFFQYARL